MKKRPFKACTTCEAVWQSMESFLSDPEVALAGYQVHFDDLEGGLFFFNHQHEGCFTTLAIPVKEFISLSKRPLLAKRDKQLCHGSDLCVRQGALTPHPVECECAWVREILTVIKNWKDLR